MSDPEDRSEATETPAATVVLPPDEFDEVAAFLTSGAPGTPTPLMREANRLHAALLASRRR
jgi:hypothetical protein